MKRKQLIKQARNVPDEAIECYLTHSGHPIADYFLLSQEGHHIIGCWSLDGKQQILTMYDDEEWAFAIQQYLVRHGAPIYENGSDVPKTKSESAQE